MIDDIIIEPMAEEYIKDVALLEKQCFSTPWSENSLRAELVKENALFFVAKTKNEVSGYIGANNVLGEVYINNVAVFCNYRNFGIGEKLLRHLVLVAEEKDCDLVTLEVRKSNEPAKKLYEKVGFEIVGERKKFYEKPTEDALIYTKYLKANL